ncbi:unnamed protein product [Arabis nemorensis]|uniref:Poly A polymerase head domain-containing protein n=1 Tax=Arabis nemorensis TaxID=586526 RepID=A0A565AWP2_9BRAS|nr:unnamed protein product [Arabis nemorensis]
MWRRVVSTRVKSVAPETSPLSCAFLTHFSFKSGDPKGIYREANGVKYLAPADFIDASPLSSAFRRHFSSKSGDPKGIDKEDVGQADKDEWELDLEGDNVLGNLRKPKGRDIVYKVYDILRNEEWSVDLEKLENLKLNFNRNLVQGVLELSGIETSKALLFFRWLDVPGRFKHDGKTYNSMARVLGKENIDQFHEFIEEMRSLGYHMESKTYVTVLNRFLKAEMITEAVELFELAMAGRNKPTEQLCHLVLCTIFTANKDMDLISRTVKAYTRNGKILSDSVQGYVLRSLKMVGRDELTDEVLKAMNEGEGNLGEMDTLLLTHVVKKIVDAKSNGIKVSMIPVSAWIVLRALRWQGFDAYLVGGCVRDLLMKRTPRDFDVVTTASVDQVRQLFEDSQIVGNKHPICKVSIGESVIEVSNVGRPLVPSSLPCEWDKIDYILYANSQKRDFTINSLFLDLLSYQIYDYNNGIEDLENRMLRTMIAASVSFKRDCARILRGVRIAARLDLSFSEEIEDAIPKRIHLVARLGSFRLTRELNYMFSYGAAIPSINLLQKLKLLHILLPFQAACLEGGEEETTKSSAMLERLFSNLDKLHSCGNPAADSLWLVH